MAEKYSIAYMYHILFIHLSVNGHLGYFHVLAIVNSAAANTGVHLALQIMVSSRYICRSGIAGSYGRFYMQFSEEAPYCFPQWLYQLTVPPTVQEGCLFSYSLQHLLLDFLMKAILASVRYLVVVAICISLINHAGLSLIPTRLSIVPPPACALTVPLPRMLFTLICTAQAFSPPPGSDSNATFSERSLCNVLYKESFYSLFLKVLCKCSIYLFLFNTYDLLKLTYLFTDLWLISSLQNICPRQHKS